jgi:hypothetical protein
LEQKRRRVVVAHSELTAGLPDSQVAPPVRESPPPPVVPNSLPALLVKTSKR